MKYRLRKAGFTLVELLVVIGIIALLAGIIIPTVNKLRQAAQKADTANEIGVIRSGIDVYYTSFRAYPGPLRDEVMFGTLNPADPNAPVNISGPVTESENLTLGLLGGLAWVNGVVTYTGDLSGPRSLNANNPKKYEPFVNDAAKWLSKNGTPNDPATGVQGVADSNIPEFMDRFSTPMPILYLRARTGATGIVSDGVTTGNALFQYDVRQYAGYIAGKYAQHDQTVQGQSLAMINASPVPPPPTGVPYDALQYLKNPTLTGTLDNLTGTPRCKDGYILISAGADRIFGTLDDITSFGNVGE